MAVPVTGLYAGLLALILLVLAIRVGMMRVRTGVSILHGDDMELAQVIRRHANFTETVPMALILLCVLELNGASHLLLHTLGTSLVIARLVHPVGLVHDNLRSPLRGLGAGATTLVTLAAAAMAIAQFYRA
jgi:uncharacterized membrane protein YecN with MAPEG domain